MDCWVIDDWKLHARANKGFDAAEEWAAGCTAVLMHG
jgi:hypothetical protein